MNLYEKKLKIMCTKSKIIIDLDGTLTIHEDGEYVNAKPNESVISQLRLFKSLGYKITIFTARNMRKFDGNLGLINIYTLPNIIDWLKKYEIPHDEVIVGKPWCGHDGFYVDDRAIRPDEFVKMTAVQIIKLLEAKEE